MLRQQAEDRPAEELVARETVVTAGRVVGIGIREVDDRAVLVPHRGEEHPWIEQAVDHATKLALRPRGPLGRRLALAAPVRQFLGRPMLRLDVPQGVDAADDLPRRRR